MKNLKKTIYQVTIDKNFCKNCLICLNICPKEVFGIDTNHEIYIKNLEDCIGCKLCENLCPDFAIEVFKL